MWLALDVSAVRFSCGLTASYALRQQSRPIHAATWYWIAIEGIGKSIGGYVTNLSWSIVTSGSPAQVGSVDANGIYTAPSDPLVGIVQLKASVNTANFFVNVRNIKPTPRTTSPNAFLHGRKAEIWVTPLRATDNDIIRLAADGSPDAVQNPGMINLGTLQASATFAEEIETTDFTNDDGIYATVTANESATLSGTMLEVRDLDKLAVLMQHATLHPSVKGVRELSVGDKPDWFYW